MKFTVGDEVRYVQHCNGSPEQDAKYFEIGQIYTITGDYGIQSYYLDRISLYVRDYQLEPLLKEITMRERIEALTGWDKEADDLLKEIGEELYICVPTIQDKWSDSSTRKPFIEIQNSQRMTVSPEFEYNSQCSKLRAFKDALLWLAEKAGKLEDKDKLKAEIHDLRKKLIDLERRVK